MQIGQLAEQTGASVRSIRYYESVGLLTSVRRVNGYREFDDSATDRVAKIKLLLQVGLDIADIAAVLPCVGTVATTRCDLARQRVDDQISRIERQQGVLARARAALVQLRTDDANTPSAIAGASRVREVNANVTVGVN